MDKNIIAKESHLNIIFSVYIFVAILYVWLNVKGVLVTEYIKKPVILDNSPEIENYLLSSIIPFVIITFVMLILMQFSAKRLRPNVFLPIINIVLSSASIFFLFPHFFWSTGFGDSVDIIIHEVILMICRALLLTYSIIMLCRYIKTSRVNTTEGTVEEL